MTPTDTNSYYKLGLIYEVKKDYAAAIEQLKKAIELKTDHAKALNALGRVYMKTGRLREAKEMLEAAKVADPGLVETTVLLNNVNEELSPTPRKHKKKKVSRAKKGKTAKKSGAAAAPKAPATAKPNMK